MAIRKKILWLVSWYPNKYDRYDGDSIQRHAKAAALFDDVHVIFIKGAEQQAGIKEEWSSTEGLTEQIIYFSKREGCLQKPGNYLQWQSLYKKAINNYCKNKLPQLIHVHIPWKAGLIALWAKKKYRLPFIVTEHWGIYNNVAEDNIYTKSFLRKILMKKIFKEANEFYFRK